jgi:hypothetical protein
MSASKVYITDTHNVRMVRIGKDGEKDDVYKVYNDDEEFYLPVNDRYSDFFRSERYRKTEPLQFSFVPDTSAVKVLAKGKIVKEYDSDTYGLNKSYVINEASFKESAGIVSVPHCAERDAMACAVAKKEDVMIFDKTKNACVQRMSAASSAVVSAVNAWQANGSGTTAMIASDSNIMTEFFDTRSNDRVYTIKGDNLTLPVQDSNYVYSINRSGKTFKMRRLQLTKTSNGSLSSFYQDSSYDRADLPGAPRGLFGNEKRMIYVYDDGEKYNVRHYDMCTPANRRRSYYVELDLGKSQGKVEVLTCAIFDAFVYVVTDAFLALYLVADVDEAQDKGDGTVVPMMMDPIKLPSYKKTSKKPRHAIMVSPDKVYLVMDDSTVSVFSIDINTA